MGLYRELGGTQHFGQLRERSSQVSSNKSAVIENGMKTVGEEYSTGVGRIYLLCEDPRGNYVVIETKKRLTSDAAVGQILRYIGWLKKKVNGEVRGIIIVRESDEKLDYALAATSNIEVKYYQVRFEFHDLTP